MATAPTAYNASYIGNQATPPPTTAVQPQQPAYGTVGNPTTGDRTGAGTVQPYSDIQNMANMMNGTSQNQPTALAGALQQTPGGQWGNISSGSAGGSTSAANPINYGSSSGLTGPIPRIAKENATNWNTNIGPVDTGVDAFRQFGDSAYDLMISRNAPQQAQAQNALAQSLVDRGLQPGTAAYNAEMTRMDQQNSDYLNSAAVQAEQLGLAAQNQYFGQQSANNQFELGQAQQNYGQQFGYDQLANALAQSSIAANAQTTSAGIGAGASMTNARLNNELGYAQLASNDRQFDINNIFQTNGQNQNYNLGLMSQYNNAQQTAQNAFQIQQNADNQWWNQTSGMVAQGPGVIFNPNTGYTNSQIQGNQNMIGAIGAENQQMASLAGGLMASDERLKENIEFVYFTDGVNVYDFDYIDKSYGEGRYRGVMAQEVEVDYPKAVFDMANGYKAVDYSQLPVNMERVA